MSTYMANAQSIDRKWYVVDAASIPLGRVATAVAVLLRGKHKPEFTPHVDCGDHVIVINAEKAVLTGKKLDQKFYRTHSGYVGGLKETKYRLFMQTNPDKAMKIAVKGMLPKNIIGGDALSRLRVYKGDTHPHEAQQPVEYKVKIGG